MEFFHKDERLMVMDEMLARKVFEQGNPGVDFDEFLRAEQEFAENKSGTDIAQVQKKEVKRKRTHVQKQRVQKKRLILSEVAESAQSSTKPSTGSSTTATSDAV